MVMKQLIAAATLDAAFVWLCHRRREYPDHADVWSFRRNWPHERARLTAALTSVNFEFSLLSRVTLKSGEDVDLWSARDALVLKALILVLSDVLPVSASCVHIKGHGGAKAAVRQVDDNLDGNRFVFRTDVKSFYASIGHGLLIDRLAEHISDRRVLNLLNQYMRRTSERGGWFYDHRQGLSLGCPLSPLMGAFFLYELDRRMERTGLFYVRFMVSGASSPHC
jgi:RNA-directed DNA polymerase